MSALEWFLSYLALPLSAVAMAVLLVTWPRNLLMPITGWLVMRRVRAEQEALRSLGRGGSGEDAGSPFPRTLPARAGGAARPDFAAPPLAPSALVGAVDPHTAPASHHPGGERR